MTVPRNKQPQNPAALISELIFLLVSLGRSAGLGWLAHMVSSQLVVGQG